MKQQDKTKGQLIKELSVLKKTMNNVQTSLRANIIRQKSILDNIPDMAWLKDQTHKFVVVNEAFGKACGKKPLSLVGKTDFDIWPSDIAKNIQDDDKQLMAKKEKRKRTISQTMIRAKGEQITIETIKSCVFDDKGKIIGTTGFSRDITEQVKSEKEREKLIGDILEAREALHFQATHDELSGVWDRHAILDILQKEISRSTRSAAPVSVIMGDIDNFSELNAEHGESAGDTVLVETARRLITSTRPYDSIGRYGGEEFLVILPNCDIEAAGRTAERLRESFSKAPLKTTEGSFKITMSFGVSAFDVKNKDLNTEEIVKQATDALYNAKNKGANRVCY